MHDAVPWFTNWPDNNYIAASGQYPCSFFPHFQSYTLFSHSLGHRARFRVLSSRSARDSLGMKSNRGERLTTTPPRCNAKRNARNHVRATNRPFRSARRNAGYNLIDLARGGGILQVLKTTAHQTAMLARPRFTCPGTVSQANSRAVRDVIWLYRRMSAAHVTQQSRWACKTSIAKLQLLLFGRSVSLGRRRHVYSHTVDSHILRLSSIAFSSSRAAICHTRESTLYRVFFCIFYNARSGDVRIYDVRGMWENSAHGSHTPDTRLARANTHASDHSGGGGVTLRHLLSRSFSVTWIAAWARARALLPFLLAGRRTKHGATLYCLLSPVLSRARVRVNACPRGRQMQPSVTSGYQKYIFGTNLFLLLQKGPLY